MVVKGDIVTFHCNMGVMGSESGECVWNKENTSRRMNIRKGGLVFPIRS